VNIELIRAECVHAVQFYSRDDELIDTASSFLIEGALRGEAAIVIATPKHRATLIEVAGYFGPIVAMDAEDTLRRFMVDDRPNPGRFEEVVGTVVRAAVAQGNGARAFGEMVAILWREGNVVAALELEELWNGLLDAVDFCLLCAYPTSLVQGQGAHVTKLCGLHSDVVGTPFRHETQDLSASLALPLSVQSPRRARLFTAETLEDWGFARFIDDASLIVTELGTNAITHGREGFTVTINSHHGVVRIEVQDRTTTLPTRLPGTAGAVSGRGLVLVDAVAKRWGAAPTETGKIVWAELRDVPVL
jgi:hypothetical protein